MILNEIINAISDRQEIHIKTTRAPSGIERRVLYCVTAVADDDGAVSYADTDVSSESEQVQDLATIVWTEAAKAAQIKANQPVTLSTLF